MRLAVLLSLWACSAKTPESLAAKILAPCPRSPNCVHTGENPGDPHFIEPIRFTEPPDEIWKQLHEVVVALPRVSVEVDDPDYRHYIFTTALMRFRDDVQFRLDREGRVLHFRSASRVGQSDLGVNRRRMERIREDLHARVDGH